MVSSLSHVAHVAGMVGFILICLVGQIVGRPLPVTPIELPRDDGFLLTPVQWWYWTGHLQTRTNQTFGFEYCFFIVEGLVNLVQVAVTDVGLQKFSYLEDLQVVLDVRKMNISSGYFDLVSQSGVQGAKGGNGADNLRFQVGDYSVKLGLQSSKPPAEHYKGKAHPYSFGGFTYYYSRTAMNVLAGSTMTNTKTGEELSLTGTSWFDRQWGDLAHAVLQGWQWFAIELNDNIQLMLFDFLADDTEKYGSVTLPDGSTVDLAGANFAVTVLSNWTSPASKCTYPASWAVDLVGVPGIPDQTILVTPKVADQELRVLDSPTYWEGACYVEPMQQATSMTTGGSEVSGSGSINNGGASGQAYVEHNGFCKKL